jgi:hypothetical protein
MSTKRAAMVAAVFEARTGVSWENIVEMTEAELSASKYLPAVEWVAQLDDEEIWPEFEQRHEVEKLRCSEADYVDNFLEHVRRRLYLQRHKAGYFWIKDGLMLVR